MNTINETRYRSIKAPSWENVRSIYKKLSEEFRVLTGAYGLTLSDQTKFNLDHLIIVIDEVDSCIDELPEKEQRDSITDSLVNFLENNEAHWNHPNATESLATKMEHIKYIVHYEKILPQFVEAAKAIFHYTEIKRHTSNQKELIHLISEEGRATAQLPLSILKLTGDEPFGIFFTRLCMLMGIADLIFDAKSDYKKNYIVLRPSLSLYLQLNWIMMKEGLKLLIYFPKKLKFIVYCFKFTTALIKEQT